ncbi:MAG: GNAT family N-acetyltransferase [Planctomycetes bacterium]|nr:GNAT family N-acetyltransferase [Planctomycetota bacterium]
MDTLQSTTTRLVDPTYPKHLTSLPDGEIAGGNYVTRFARTREDLLAIQRLRFEVFNLELSEGLDASFVTGLDQDEFDLTCHHLMVRDTKSGVVVGTYRVQTRAMAASSPVGWYTATEYDLSQLPDWLLDAAVETGRACVAKDHRNGRVLQHLWRGLAAYLSWNHKRYLFGCCSLTTQDPHLAKATHEFLAQGGFVRRELAVRTLPAFECYPPDFEAELDTSVKLPPLFASYLKLGAKILGSPALDRQFKTVDYLALLDIQDLEPHTYRMFFPRRPREQT